MSLSKKPADDKKPIPRAKLEQLLIPGKKPEIKAEDPSLKNISLTRNRLEVPKEIPISKISSTAVVKPITAVAYENIDKRKSLALDNTIEKMAMADGYAPPAKNTPVYNQYKTSLDFARKTEGNSLVIKEDEDGKPIYGTQKSFWESGLKAITGYKSSVASGTVYIESTGEKNKKVLENKRYQTNLKKGIPQFENEAGAIAGGLVDPIVTSVVIGLPSAAVTLLGVPGAAKLGASLTAGTVGVDMVKSKYGTSLEENYFLAREQGMSIDESYEKAKNVAVKAAGAESLVQVAFAGMGAIGEAPQALLGGVAPTARVARILGATPKKEALKVFAKGFGENLRSAVGIGAIVGAGQAITDNASEQEGIHIENKDERALEGAGHMVAMDLAIKMITRAPGTISKSAKSFAKGLLASDQKLSADFMAEMESLGQYEAGTKNQVMDEVKKYSAAEKKTPNFSGDGVKKTIATGLIEKRTKLETELNNLDPVFREEKQLEIDEVNARLKELTTTDKPFSVETELNPKKQESAITETTGKVQEVTTEGGVSEYQGTGESQQVETAGQAETVKADTSNRPIVGTEEVVAGVEAVKAEEPTKEVKLSDKIRKFKLDESLLTGGDKGAMQSNIAGLPIGIYNASIEAIALTVEAGENIAAAIDRQIESLKKGGRTFDEEKFRKSIMLIDKVNKDKGKGAAEAEMSGIKTEDYNTLQRLAVEKYNESEVFRDPVEMGKRLRSELDKKMDTSKISDEVFEMIGYDAIVNEKEAPFLPGAQKRATVPKSEFALEKILTNPKEVFKAIYTAASTQAKSTVERLNMASTAISDAIFNEKGERVNPKVIAKAIQKFVTSKMDTDTAAIEFANNINEIKRLSVNVRKFGEIRKQIADIKKASKSKSFGTIATRQNTADIDFIAPSKVRDYGVDGNGKIIELDTDIALNEYIENLENYRKSITGEIPETDGVRNKTRDFINDQRDKYEAMQIQKAEVRKYQYESRYDKLLADGKIGNDENGNVISKEDFVGKLIDPNKKVSVEVEDAVDLALETEAEVMREMTDVRQEMLKESIDNGEIDLDVVDDAKLIANIDAKKIKNKNIKLFNNIIEDIVNGESPSMMGEIVSDIEAFNNKAELFEGKTNIRDMAKYRKAGFFANIASMFGKERGIGAYADLGLSNLFRLVTSNPNGAAAIRKVIWAPFEKENLKVNNMAKDFAQKMSDVFTKKQIIADVNGVKTRISFNSDRLTSTNSYRIGIASTLAQFEDLGRQIKTITDAVKTLSEKSYDNGNRVKDYVDNTIMALEQLGIISGHTSDKNEVITNITVNDTITMSEINSRLNDRETYAVSMIKSSFKDIAPDLDYTMRQYFGKALDMSNENYVPLVPMLFGEAPEVLLEGEIDMSIPSHISTMRSSTTRERQANLSNVVKKNGIDTFLYYDFDVYNTMARKYHESLNTAYTTAPVAALRKTINSKEFIEFISGKGNQKPNEFIDNKVYFRRQISDVVNMERMPFVLTKEMENQRNRLAKFFMGRMLNSVDATIKQYAPSVPLMFMHGGMKPFSMSYDLLLTKRILDPKTSNLLIEFYSQTSQANRLTGGIESFTQKAKSINNNKIIRGSVDTIDFVESISGIPLDIGDKATTMQSLMIGYIKGLKISGKIKDYSEFNLETELRNGLDPLALSHAEQFLSFINNESTSAKKGKVFRQDNAIYMRMLQSFSHNQNVNALIDLGIMQDYVSGKVSKDDAKQAALGASMFLTNIASYGLVMYGLGKTNYKIAKKGLELTGIKLHENEDEQKKNFEKDATRITIGSSVDAVTGRFPLPVGMMVKFGVGTLYGMNKESVAEAKKIMGEDINGTIYDDNFEPILMNQYMGMAGSAIQDLEILYKTSKNSSDKYSALIPDQRNAMYNAENVKRFSLLLPFKSFTKLANNAQKVIKDHQISQLDVDGDMYIRAMASKIDNEKALNLYSQEELDEANAYIAYKDKTDKDFRNYFATTVKKHAETTLRQQDIENTASGLFGTERAKILKNISTKKGNDVIRIMNNRYANKDIYNDEEVKFMLMNSIIYPTEYAISIAYDKKGELRTDASDEKIVAEVMKRQVDAEILTKFAKWGKGDSYPKIDPKNIYQIYQQFSANRYQEREQKK
jgi:hypothetical protein